MFANTSSSSYYSRLHLGVGVVVYSTLLGIVVALIADCYEIGFKYLAKLWHEENSLLDNVPIWLVYATGPFLAGPILYIIISRIPERRAHNPADLITGIHLEHGRINASATLLTALASAISIVLSVTTRQPCNWARARGRFFTALNGFVPYTPISAWVQALPPPLPPFFTVLSVP